MINGHGGNVYEWARKMACSPDDIVDMSSNINPLGTPSQLLDTLKDQLYLIHRLPEVDNKTLIRKFAAFYDKHVEQVVAESGTTDFIYQLPKILGSKKALIVGPTYADYADACERNKVDVHYLLAEANQNFIPEITDDALKKVDTVFLCNPNNPTGHFMFSDQLKEMCQEYPDVRFIIDESYLHFCPEHDDETMIRCGLANVIVLCSFSKIFAIPGLRLGFVVAHKDIIQSFRQLENPWNVNCLAQIAGTFLFDNMLMVQDFIHNTTCHIQTEKNKFQSTFANYPHVKMFGTFAPYLLIQLPDHIIAESVCSRLIKKKYLIRNCSNFYGLTEHFIRIAYKDADNNKILLEYLTEIL